MKKSFGEKVFDVGNTLFMLLLVVATLYPILYVIFASFSDPVQLARHDGLLFFPAGFSLKGYSYVFKNKEIYIGYANTLIYVIGGTAVNMILTILGAYALSRKDLMLKKPIMVIITFTMFFNGGLIPSYLVVQRLGLLDTAWAMILPCALSTWNMIVLRTAFGEISESLLESARIDGAGELRILVKIVVPVSMASIAAISLFYAVWHWNEWFSALLYLQDRNRYPLQMFLRELLIIPQNSNNAIAADVVMGGESSVLLKEVIKYCTILVSMVPILCVYPFVQKYFVKGVLIGSIKE